MDEELKVSSVSLSGQEIKKSQSNNTNFAEWVEENFGDFKLEKLDEMIMSALNTNSTNQLFLPEDQHNISISEILEVMKKNWMK